MKKLFLLLIALWGLWVSQTYAYSPNDVDFAILDRIENKVFELVENDKIEPEDFVSKIQQLLDDKEYSDRVEWLLGLLIGDLSYSYWLGWDSEEFEMTEEECYDDEIYDADAGVCIPDYYDDGRWDEYSDDYGEYDDGDYYDDSGEYEDDYYDDEEYDDYSDEDSYPTWYGGNEDFWDEYLDDDYNNEYDDEEYSSDYGDGQSSDPEQQVPNDASYKVENDTITLLSWKKDATHEKIWNMFITLVPAAKRVELKSFNVYTDKNDGNIAGVFLNPEANNTWDLTVNKALFYDANGNFDVKENIHTLVHEFAHLLTLGKEQVDYIPADIQSDSAIDRLESKCSTTFVSEGCLKANAYIEKFIKRFWTKKEITMAENGQWDLYSGNETKFVSDYAATDTAEDMAETFTYFVLQGKPDWDTVAEKKILFFYDFEELIALRELIRKRVAELN